LEVETIGGEALGRILRQVRRFDAHGNGHAGAALAAEESLVIAPGRD
jgi:hypothetical protein